MLCQKATSNGQAGEQRLLTGDVTGRGGKDVGMNGSQQPAASSTLSAQNGKRNIGLTLADTLDMINSALWYYHNAGGKLRIGNSVQQSQTAILALPGVQMCQKCYQLKLFEDIIDGQCQKCAGGQKKGDE